MSVNSAKNIKIKYIMSWFKSDPATLARREAEKAEKAAYNTKFNADVKDIHMTNELIAFLNNIDFLDGIGRYDTIKAMNMIDALGPNSSFDRILGKSVKLNNLKLVKKILAKTQELDVDIAPRNVNNIIREEKMMGRTDKSKKISEEIMQTLQSYLDGESINAPATTPMNTVVQNNNAKYNADVEGIHMTNELIAFLNNPDFLDGIGPRQSIKVKSMINALGPTANFGSILNKVVKLNNLELVNVIITKVEELKVDITPRNINNIIRGAKTWGRTNDKSKKISEEIMQTLKRYLDGEIINTSAPTPAASIKPAATPSAAQPAATPSAAQPAVIQPAAAQPAIVQPAAMPAQPSANFAQSADKSANLEKYLEVMVGDMREGAQPELLAPAKEYPELFKVLKVLDPKLPPGWVAKVSTTTGKTYYEKGDVSQWNKPTEGGKHRTKRRKHKVKKTRRNRNRK